MASRKKEDEIISLKQTPRLPQLGVLYFAFQKLLLHFNETVGAGLSRFEIISSSRACPKPNKVGQLPNLACEIIQHLTARSQARDENVLCAVELIALN